MQRIYPQTYANGLPASLWAIWTSAAPIVFRAMVGSTIIEPADAFGVDLGTGVTLDDALANANPFGVDPDRGVGVA